MKEKISPPVMIVAVVVVLALVAFIGYKVFAPGGNVNGEEYKKKYLPAGAPTRTSPGEGSSMIPPGAPPGYKPPSR